MLPKQLKILSTALAILGIAAFFIFQYVIQHQFKSVDQCDDEKDDPAINFNQDFFEGCKQYFNHQ